MTPHGAYGSPSTTPRVGELVAGRYRIEGELGHGGFGAVYRATHVQLGRAVALKMLLPDMLSHDEGLVRFRREAELAQRLEHPNTVRLYDFGQTEIGLPYIAFELLRGEPLDRAIHASGPMPDARVARIVSQVLKSLMEAHGLGIIHRDIKPANVFLCEFSGERDFVKVLDFGIAKSTSSNTLLTKVGATIGTPNFMSPEQVRGEVLTAASDLYSVGLMMAEMLTGRMVFAGSPTEVYMAQVSPDPVPLPPALFHSALHRIVLRATQKDISRRYASAAEMLRDFESIAAPAPQPSFAAFPPAAAAAPTQIVQTMRTAPPGNTLAARIVLVVAAVLLLVIAIFGSFLFRVGGRDGPSNHATNVDDEGDDKPKKKKKKSSDDDVEPDSSSLRGKLQKLGWKITAESTSKQQAVSVTTYTCQKGSQMAIVYLYDMQDETTAAAIEKSLSSQKGSAVRRKGLRLYWVFTMPADAALADKLLDDLDV